MQVLNLIKESEMMKMKEMETIKDYSDKLEGIVNKIRLLEESKDLSSIFLAKLVNALEASEQRRKMRQEALVEGAFRAKFENLRGKNKKIKDENNNNNKTYPSCPYFRDTRALSKIYERCNVTIFESFEFKEAEKDDKRIEAMREKQLEAL
ncbi:hypothetical protein J1N35_005063 [Gossypium stocksii]|uniref:Uncharacterized protein n=1 Tax=Gossypium stocksii TaxID=47602 RepID=A0A9D3WDX2_9ROSI|nr:hypothetical protein J1N35_005063 [Gossypium stocksii]